MKAQRLWRVWPLVAATALAASLSLHGQPVSAPAFRQVASPTLDSSGWSLTADSQAPSAPPNKADDGDATTSWQSDPAAALPQALTIDMKQTQSVAGLRYTPPALGSGTGIESYRVDGSTDGSTWTTLTSGTWADDGNVETVTFPTASVQLVRLVGLSSASGQVAVAEIALLGPDAPADPPPHPGWSIAVDSNDADGPKAIDGDRTTVWRSATSSFPHTATVDTGAQTVWSELRYTPPPDRTGTIGRYQVATSVDDATWRTVATGELADDTDTKTITFTPTSARYVRLTALSEAGDRGAVTAAAEIDLVQGTPLTAAPTSKGRWTAPINFPIVPAAVALLPNGKVLAWSSDGATSYGGAGGLTHTVVYDPATGAMTHVVVTNTGQDMFCPGIAMMGDGRVAVFGGHFTAARISVYNAATGRWSAAAPMRLTRGYESAVTQADQTVFVIGGSWGDQDNTKNGEVWSTRGSTLLPGAPVAPMLTSDREGIYRSDNHGWLFTFGPRVLQVGPSKHMNWYSTKNGGTVTSAGLRGDDDDAMNGSAAMFTVGKILTLGGAPDYTGTAATNHANVITIAGSRVTVTKVAPMHYPRSFATSVVLPDGSVFVSGGMQFPKTFSDATAVLTPELWDPASQTFHDMADMQVPRTYHSEALLLQDGRVFVGGGGLCGTIDECDQVTHADAQIWSPPYLFSSNGRPAPRPWITSAPTSSAAGRALTVHVNTAVTKMVLVRDSAVTHSVNTDQRRIPLAFTGSPARGYTMHLPSDRGIMVPGSYMLFAINASGVPSVARIINIR